MKSSNVNGEEIQKEERKWQCFEERYDKKEKKKVRKPMVDSKKEDVSVFFNVVYDYETRHDLTICKKYVELISQSLIKILRDISPDNKDFHNEMPKVKAQSLYHIMEELHSEAEKAPVLNHLIQYLEKEFGETNKIYEWMNANQSVSFDMLWAFYTENRDVWYRCEMSGQHVGGRISSISETISYIEEANDFRRVLNVRIKVVDYDTEGFKHCLVNRRIVYFSEQKNFSDLPVVPLGFSQGHGNLEDTIIDAGRQFFKLASGRNFKSYEGPLLHWKLVGSCMKVEMIRADGRVMIDLESFAIMNPDYKMGNAKPPNKCEIELSSESGIYLDKDKEEANYYLAPALVFGFSFALKKWGQFMVMNFSNIHFEVEAFKHLVMHEDRKKILEGLVRSQCETNDIAPLEKSLDHIAPLEKPLDPISNKGKGCIFLCHGPPGTGKTLTAESVAELIKRPLWTVSVHELGMKAAKMEERLVKILDVAFIWKAVLLLDEADIYLEKRNSADLKRNAMVGVFLRHLEYYQGILFLTTNRVTNFDDAICSRISMFFHYPNFDLKQRRDVWNSFILKASLPLKADPFCEYELNGREIRNVLNAAQTLAKSQGKDITEEHVIKVIDTIQGFQKDMGEIRTSKQGNDITEDHVIKVIDTIQGFQKEMGETRTPKNTHRGQRRSARFWVKISKYFTQKKN